MSIQILSLRKYLDKKTNKEKIAVKQVNKLSAVSLDELFIRPTELVNRIPEKERYNIFYTLANCDDSADNPRVFLSQDVIPFDIDGINHKREQDYIKYVCEVLAVLPTQIVIVSSGNGFHFLIRVANFKQDYFAENKIFYKAVCTRINNKLKEKGLSGQADTTAFEPRRIFRLPNTKNIKPDKPEKNCVLLNPILTDTGFNLRIASGIENIKAGEFFSPESFQKINYSIDTKAVLSGCDFLKYCSKNPKKLSEPEWKAMISVLTHLPDGRALAHEYSREHPDYSKAETDDKFEQAKVLTGARTCNGINNSVFDCSRCPNFNIVSCPVFIKGENFIATEATGFHTIIKNPEGVITKRIPNHEDLKRYFKRQNASIIVGHELYYYKDDYWNKITRDDFPLDLALKGFAMDNFKPRVNSQVRAEFYKEVLEDISMRRTVEVFNKSTEGKINLKNGVYDLRTSKMVKHDKKFGFTYKLDYDYEANGPEPVKFLKFMDEITEGAKDVQKILFEYAGYMLSGDSCKGKCLFLVGVGGTAKSTFGDVIKMLVPEDSYSSVKVEKFHKENYRSMMFGKLFNIGDETNPKGFIHSGEDFKTMVTGGEVDARKLYANSFKFKFKTKILLTGNELPYNYDTSNSIYSRLIPITFHKVFRDAADENKEIVVDMMDERAGILRIFAEAYSKVDRHFSIPESSKQDLREYRASNDSVNCWLGDMLELAPAKEIILNEAISNYENYCRENHLPILKLQKNAFSKKITDKFNKKSARKRINGLKTVVFEGLGLRSAF